VSLFILVFLDDCFGFLMVFFGVFSNVVLASLSIPAKSEATTSSCNLLHFDDSNPYDHITTYR
jgi:hypothetical protein